MNLKNFILGVAIALLTVFVVAYGINTFYERPNYDDFCGENIGIKIPRAPENPDVCPAVCIEMYEIKGGTCVLDSCGSGCRANNVTTFDTLESCQEVLDQQTCYERYDEAREDYSRNLFLIALPLGIILIIVGALVFGLEAVGAGLMGGGVFTIFYGVINYWQYSANAMKFVLSLIGLVIVIGVAYWFNKKEEKKKRKRK